MIVHTMKSILTWFFLLPLVLTKAHAQNPFLTLKYDSLVWYDYKGYKGNFDVIDKSGKLNKSVVKSAVLDAVSAKEFSRRLGLRSSYGQAKAFCFDPHLGIVYYKAGKAIATVLICMDCNILEPSLHLKAQEQGYDVGGPGNPTGLYTGGGMSPAFRKYINSLLIKYRFSHQIDPRGNAIDGYH